MNAGSRWTESCIFECYAKIVRSVNYRGFDHHEFRLFDRSSSVSGALYHLYNGSNWIFEATGRLG